jgi:hypothetical protein
MPTVIFVTHHAVAESHFGVTFLRVLRIPDAEPFDGQKCD